MCRSMVDIHSATAEIRRGKKERPRKKKKQQDENIMSASATAKIFLFTFRFSINYDCISLDFRDTDDVSCSASVIF